MAQLVADYVLGRLRDWRVHRIYGYPGDGINGFLGALDRADGDPELIQVRHEEMAAFMAGAHAKFADEVGVCMATSGPGAIHLLNGLYDARMDHQPVVAIVGQQSRLSIGAHYQQEVDLPNLFKDVSEYVHQCSHPGQARHLVDRAIRIALAERSVCTLIFPNDVQEEEAIPSPPKAHGTIYTSVGYEEPRVVPPEPQIRRAAEVLNSAERPAILIGQGAARAADQVIETAEILGTGIAKALLGKAAVPDDLPFVTGPIGLLGSTASHDMVTGCDALLMVGTSFPYSEWLPDDGSVPAVEIDLDARMIGARYPADVHLVGDARETLKELIPLLRRNEDRGWRERIEKSVAEWWRVLEDRAMEPRDPMNPERVTWELSRRLPDGAILVADSGSSTNWWARNLRVRTGMMASLSGTLATMGCAVPYAIGAKFAHPGRPVVAVLGDGAFQMNGMNEMLTIKRYWERWADPRLVVCVFNNQDLNQVTWEQRAMAGDPKFMGSQWLPDMPYARYAELVGLAGVRCEDGDAVGEAWEEALNAGRPCLLEVVTDPEVPPLPPQIRMEQAKAMARALAKGDPEGLSILQSSIRGKWHEIREALPGRGP